MSLRAEDQAGSPQWDPPRAKKGGIRRRLAWLFSRSEISLTELQRKEGIRDGPSTPGAAAHQDGKGKGRRKEKRSKLQGSLQRMAEEDKISAGGRRSEEPPHPSGPQKASSKLHALSYSESDLWRNGLLRTFGTLPWRRRQSSQLELSGTSAGGTGHLGSSLGQSWPFARLQRPAVGSDLDMAGRLDLCSAGNLAGEQETPKPSAWPMDTENSKPATPSQVEIFTSFDSLLDKEDGSSWGESVSIGSTSLDIPASPKMQGEDYKHPASQEEPSRAPEPLTEWAESLFQEYLDSGTFHPKAAGQPDHASHGHRESISEPETCPFASPSYNQISRMEEPAIGRESPERPLETIRGVEPAPAKRPVKIRYEVMITLTKEQEEAAKSRAEDLLRVCGNGLGSHGAAKPAGEAGVSQEVAELQKMDEQCHGEPARPAPQLAARKEFQNFMLQREGTAGVTGQVRPVTGCLVTPLQGSVPSPRQRRDWQEQSLSHCRDLSVAEGRAVRTAGAPASSAPSSFGPCRDGEEAQSERACDAGTGLDEMKKVGGSACAHHSKPGKSTQSTWFSWKKTPADHPKEEAKPCIRKVSLLSRRLEAAASSSRVAMLLEAWEKGTIGRESVDLPSPTDSSCSRSPGLQKDFSEHTPVFSQIYSPVQKETRPTERGKQAADSTTVTESQRDGHLSRAASTAIPTGSPRESHKPSARSTTTPTGSPRESHMPNARSTTTPPGSPRESHMPNARSTTTPTGSPRESHTPNARSTTTPTGSPRESHTPSAHSTTTPTGSPRESHTPSAVGTNTPICSPRESHRPSAVGVTPVTSSQRQSHFPNAGSTTVFRSEREILMLKAGSTVGFRSGREVIVPTVESTSVSEFTQRSGTSVPGSPSESCWQCAGGSLMALGEAASSSAAGSLGENCMMQAGSTDVSESQGDRGILGAFSTSITEPQMQTSPFAVSRSETECSLPGPGGAATAGSEMESSVPNTEGAVLAAPGTKNTSKAAGEPGNSTQAESGNPEPSARVQLSASQAKVRGEGDEPAQNSEGSAQEPNVSSEETKASPEDLSHAQPTGSHQEMTEEDPDLSVDMELLVDTLRNMEPSEIRKPPKISRLSRCSSRGKYATLPPIDEYHVAPKSQVPFPEALSELFGRTEWKQLEENGPKQENVDPSGEEEEEIENPYLSKDEKPQAKEEPRKVYPWENMSTEIEEKTLSLLGKLRQPPGDEKTSRNQSILFNANILKGASLLKELQEQKAVPTEDKPYSRLDSSLLYRRYVSSVTPPLKALEKEREGRSSPTPIDPALLNASRQSWMPPNGPQLKPCKQLTSEPSPAGLQEMTTVLSLDPQKAPGTDKNTGQIPLLFVEAEQKNTPPPLLGHPAAGQEAKKPSPKLNGRPGKIILFSESGFVGQKREIWGDVADATSWELSHTISIQVVRGCWVMYEKPRFHGRKCVLAEGDVEINNPWTAYGKDGEAPENAPFRIGSFKRVVRDYRIPEISLFTEENGEGTKVKFTDSSEDTRVRGKPLKASSIIVHSGLWLIYSKPFFDDDPYVLEPGGYPNLKAWGAKDPSVCSMHPIKLGCPAVEKPGEPKAVIYEKACFQGHSCEVNRDIYALKKEENSQGPVMSTVGSLRILGGCWVGYEKEGFRGHQYLLEEGEYHDWTQWGGYSDELVSLRLIRTDFSDPALVLFKAMDFQDGPSVELSEALPNVELAGYGITTQSIHVLSGVWVAYENTNFSGEQYILEKGVYRNCEDWGASAGRIASVQPVLQVGQHSLHFVSRIQLFSDPDYLGDHVSFEDDQVSLPEAFAPQSCRVHGGSWILYDGWEFEGEQHILSDGEYPTLTAMGCVSSTAIRSLQKVPIFFSEPSIFLHGLECFEGKEIELTSEVRSLQAEGFNNHVLSVRVKGGIWVLCEHSNFRGRQWLLDCTEITNWLTYSGLQHVGSLYPIRQRRIYFRIKNAELQFFLSVPDDVEDMKAGRVVVSDLSDQSSSIWYYEEGLIKNQVAPTMSLQVIGLGEKGAKVVLWAESRVPRQTWRIDSFGRICSQMFEDMILDVKGGRLYDRDHAILWDVAEERPTQIWDIQVL
ncbi:beta/gamma crystallin domain-containing protein 2 isoform X2 [Gopherus flavomarginatus]|uniref:beta/gamma crystallin domain-containing protein 2 isoform X2 n=1 Tax=Gopherus flavomarginatus TaxID=286002 RepID=UPI0021CBA391|nr:beta/gamma crystallin domain-containing protein 2 isoform X2 [Gopherus flavomarginatus]